MNERIEKLRKQQLAYLLFLSENMKTLSKPTKELFRKMTMPYVEKRIEFLNKEADTSQYSKYSSQGYPKIAIELDISELINKESFSMEYESNKEWIEFFVGPYFKPVIEHLMETYHLTPYTFGYSRRSFRDSQDQWTGFIKLTALVAECSELLAFQPNIAKLSKDKVVDVNTFVTEETLSVLVSSSPYLLSYYIDHKNPLVLDFYEKILSGEGNNADINYNVWRGVFYSGNTELVEKIGKLLLAAQRQEGLRQSIVETLDEGRIEHFVYMIKLIIDHDLIRFSSVIRGMLVWAGLYDFDITRTKITKKYIDLMFLVLSDKKAQQKLLHSEDLSEVYMALWGSATIDIVNILEDIDTVLEEPQDYKQIAVLNFMTMVQNKEYKYMVGEKILSGNPTNEVVAWAVETLHLSTNYKHDLFETTNQEYEFQEGEKLSPSFAEIVYQRYMQLHDATKRVDISFSNTGVMEENIKISRQEIQQGLILAALSLHSEEKLDAIGELSLHGVAGLTYVQYHLNTINNDVQRKQLIAMLASNVQNVSKQAGIYIREMDFAFTLEEIKKIENNLRLKSQEVRQESLHLLATQKPKDLLETVERMLKGRTLEHRLGGLDLVVNRIVKEDRFKEIIDQAIKTAVTMEISSPAEQVLVDQLSNLEAPDLNIENGLGLYTETEEVPPLEGLVISESFDFKKAFFPLSVEEFQGYYEKITDFIETHKEESVIADTFNYLGENMTYLFGNFPEFKIKYGEKEGTIIFQALWERMFEEIEIPYSFFSEHKYIIETWRLRDENISEIRDIYEEHFPWEEIQKKRELLNNRRLSFLLNDVLKEKTKDIFEEKEFNNAVQGLSYLYGVFPDNAYKYEIKQKYGSGSFVVNEVAYAAYVNMLFNILDKFMKHNPEKYLGKSMVILNTYYEKSLPLSEYRTTYNKNDTHFLNYHMVSLAYEHGTVSKNYFVKYILEDVVSGEVLSAGTRPSYRRWYGKKNILHYKELYPKSYEVVTELVDVLVGIESFRGDSDTVATPYISKIDKYYGTEHFINLLARLDKRDTFVRGYTYGTASKKDILSQLIQKAHPTQGETIESFREKMEDENIDTQILLNAAMYSKQWIPLISEYIGWPELESLMWYFRAHTGESRWNAEGEIARYSAVSAIDFEDGAFDIAWFLESYKNVGEKNFAFVYDSAKYISSAGQHRRAQIFADSALGKLKFKEVESIIKEKRTQDYVRAYGILPLKKNRNKDLLNRYEFLQKYLKESKQFGKQRQASEKLAVEIALDNLARTAKYPNTTSMILVLEGQVSKEKEALLGTKIFGDYTVEVEEVEPGKYKLIVMNAKGKTLKSVPTPLRKIPEFVLLQDTVKNIGEQYRRSIKSFENLMETEFLITAEDLVSMMESNVFRRLLENIVFKAQDNFGYLEEYKLATPEGKRVSLEKETTLQVAHPYHLFQSKVWESYQKDLFTRQIVQPFKQVFRELYTPTEDELEEGISRRYGGHQVQGNKLFGLMKARGWLQEGQRVFYGHNIIAELYGLNMDYSPGDFGEPALEIVRFWDRQNNKQVNVKDLPPVVFSEVMRDVDLFVSVAYIGGVDPETSHSTIEMRTAILREMLSLLKLKNVRLKDRFALIQGTLGEYNVHLGSANVQQMAKGSLHILPIHADHRGRIFLPFMDEDPKTAEIVSKVLLLAQDDKIQDPSILSQIKK